MSDGLEPDPLWHSGKVGAGGEGWSYAAKVYDGGSIFGICDGSISKLAILDADGRRIIEYDRGWLRRPHEPRAFEALGRVMMEFDTQADLAFDDLGPEKKHE